MTMITLALIVLLLLAMLDLWVGVANDAVNFLNSAIGSRVTSRRVILSIAAGGILVGALSSSGMMAIARKGVFDPSRFVDPSGAVAVGAIIAIYLGVMAADVLLLDLFNTFGLPTSTTVSIVSELIGASIAVTLWMHEGGAGGALSVINARSVLTIYSGIFLSVAVAFTVGAAVMYLARLVYGHDLERSFPRWGWLWTGASFAALAYFVVFKGLKGSVLLAWLPAGATRWAVLAVVVLAAVGGVVFGRRHRQVLGAIVLCGTAALAMAFAGNDLVNFIGPTVAAFQAALVEGIELSGSVPTPTWALLLAGAIMVASLVTSRKARRVTDTEVRLAAHGNTSQRFRSNSFARALVTWSVTVWRGIERLTPRGVRRAVDARTSPPPPTEDQPPYDLLRATVNLTVASLLISIGTANKLPLSTTYITFMTAMGASMADRNWTTGNAEQRVSGVLTVIGGWVVTGLLAALGGFVMASVIYLGGIVGILVAVAAIAVALRRMGTMRGAGDENIA
jgi:phosphate/sulfate permease